MQIFKIKKPYHIKYLDGLHLKLDGTKIWYKGGVPHLECGPAIKFKKGGEIWLINGLIHREDGPAFKFSSGSTQYFWKHSIVYSCKNDAEFKEWVRLQKLKAFL